MPDLGPTVPTRRTSIARTLMLAAAATWLAVSCGTEAAPAAFAVSVQNLLRECGCTHDDGNS